MSITFDTISARTLKSEAKSLRENRTRAGLAMTHGAALEEVAKAHGFRDWNTARATLPEHAAAPFQVGMRVGGQYLERPFKGMVVGVRLLGSRPLLSVTIHFDTPVDVTPNLSFKTLRQRVTATVNGEGVSPELRGNGQPIMRLAHL